MAPVAGSSRPYTPLCPVNQRRPVLSKAAVVRLAPGRAAGSGKTVIASLEWSTRTMALRPPSVTQAAPSGPTMTPWGADPDPRSMWWVRPVAGPRRPSAPAACAVYQTVPSGAGPTSWGCEPGGTANSLMPGPSAASAAVVDVMTGFVVVTVAVTVVVETAEAEQAATIRNTRRPARRMAPRLDTFLGVAHELRGKAAIVGVAESPLGEVPDMTVLGMHGVAAREALLEAGLTLADVDAVFSAGTGGMSSVETAEYLGLRPRYTDSTQIGGASVAAPA